jgi:long-chain acyl-CoA synthetase
MDETTGHPMEVYSRQFELNARTLPEHVAFRLKTPQGYRQFTYAETYRQSRLVATGLLALGVQKGARIAILSENRPEWVIAYLGVYLAGGTAVPLDPQISPAEWRTLLDDSESFTVFTSSLSLSKLQAAVQESRPPRRIISFDPRTGDRDARSELAGLIEWADSLADPPALPGHERSDVVLIIYTSGTTGNPKGVMLTEGNILGEIDGIRTTVEFYHTDKLLCLLPLQHVFASVVNFLTPLYLGAQTVFADTLKRAEILEALRESGITILATVPQFFYLLHDRIEDELSGRPVFIRKLFRLMMRTNRFFRKALRINLGKALFPKIHSPFGSSMRLFVSGGSAFDPKVAQDFHDFGFTILQGYGLTETSGGCCATRIEDNIIGSVGYAIAGAEVTIKHPDVTGVGEILVRGTMVMKGYYRNPEATAAVLRDGWLHTGDLGRLDARGNLFITGREKEIIVLPNGKNIYPDEIEAHYLQCPYIQEIAVVGIASTGAHGTSERLHGVIVPDFEYLKAKKIANAREILRDEIGHFSNQLPKYKRLMSYQVRKDPLPRTTTRKIKRLELKRLIESGELRDNGGSPQAGQALDPKDQALMASAVGQEILTTLRETYHRKETIVPDINLELDLGFDSMERVELIASLEQTLGLDLPEDFGAEIHTIRELITAIDRASQTGSACTAPARQSWGNILSDDSLQEVDAKVRFTGEFLTIVKFVGLKILYLLFRIFLSMEVRGVRNLPKGGPFLMCPNHLSYLDALVVQSAVPYAIFRRTFFVGASELMTNRFAAMLGRLTNTIPVDPDANLLRAMKVGAYGLRRGRILCIFPEGARSYDGSLQDFKKGAAILSRETGSMVLPVGIQGTYEVWPRDSMRIRPHKVKLSFGSPLVLGPATAVDPYQADIEHIRNAVAQLIE